MTTAWCRVALGDVVAFSNGVNFTKESFGTGLRIVGVRDFGDRLYPHWATVEEIDRSALSSSHALLAEGDLLFVRSNGNRSLVGRCLLITTGPEATHSAFTIRARPDRSQVLPQFLAYQMRHAHRAGHMLAASGTNITNLNQTILRKVPVFLPAIQDQIRVASVLGAIDGLIENNRQRVSVLDDMAGAIYREWFIRFRYPGYEGVSLIDSPVGSIPDGWTLRPFSEVANFLNGFAFTPAHWNSRGRPIVKIKELKQGVTASTPRCEEELIDKRFWIEQGDLLFSWSADLGVYRWSGEPALLNQHLFGVTPRGDLSIVFLQHSLANSMSQFRDRAQGTTMRHIKRSALAEVSTVVPPSMAIAAFTTAVEPLARESLILREASRHLADLRDALLPRVVTGRVDLWRLDLDALVEAAMS